MARQKRPKLIDLVRRGVEADDLDEMHYEEDQCPSTLTDVPKVTRGMRSVPSKGRKPRKRDVRRAREEKENWDRLEPRRSRNSQ